MFRLRSLPQCVRIALASAKSRVFDKTIKSKSSATHKPLGTRDRNVAYSMQSSPNWLDSQSHNALVVYSTHARAHELDSSFRLDHPHKEHKGRHRLLLMTRSNNLFHDDMKTACCGFVIPTVERVVTVVSSPGAHRPCGHTSHLVVHNVEFVTTE